MGGVLSVKLGPLFVWQVLVLIGLAGGVGAGTYVGVKAATGGGTGLTADEQLVPAQIGDMTNVVSTDGTVSFPNVETMTFPLQGTVSKVLVKAGDTVTKGQSLATIDDATQATLKAKVADARTAVTNAQDAVDAAKTPSVLDVAQKKAKVANDKQAVSTAQDALNALLDPTNAQQALSDAQDGLANAQTNLISVTDTQNTNIANAQKTADDALAAYVASFTNWLGVASASVDTNIGPTTNLSNLQINLDQLYGPNQGFINYALVSVPPDDPSTPWNESTVYWYRTFYPGSIVGTCDGTAPKQGTCVELVMDNAWTALQTDRTALTTAKVQANNNITAAKNQLTTAQQTLAGKQTALDDLKSGIDSDEVTIARASLAVAQANLSTDSDALNTLLNPTSDQLDVLNAALATAQANLSTAQTNLANATLPAPFDGVVTDVSYQEGGNAVGQGLGITVTDESTVEIAGQVDESDVLSIKDGDTASVSLTALPGQTLQGTITDIGSASNSQGVVTFPVTISVTVPQGLQLRAGLSATASVLVSQQTNVLRIPTSAVQGTFFSPYVRLDKNGKITQQPVQLGSSDSFWVVVTSGLSAGDQVVMPAPSASSTNQFAGGAVQFGGPGGVIRQFGGGAGGAFTGGGGRNRTGGGGANSGQSGN